ncbi:hypothetical protein ES705_40518 [subsurface metagenome]
MKSLRSFSPENPASLPVIFSNNLNYLIRSVCFFKSLQQLLVKYSIRIFPIACCPYHKSFRNTDSHIKITEIIIEFMCAGVVHHIPAINIIINSNLRIPVGNKITSFAVLPKSMNMDRWHAEVPFYLNLARIVRR